MSPRARVYVVLGAALAVSLVANVAAGQWTPGGVVASAVAPAALYGALELARGLRPRDWRDWLGWLTWLAAFVVAGLAFVVSYRHQEAVALRFGQDQLAASLLPVMVDIPIAVATLRLAVLARAPRPQTQAAPEPAQTRAVQVPPRTPEPAPAIERAPALNSQPADPRAHQLEQLRALPREADGTVPAARAARALGIHHTRAKPLLAELGLLRERTTA